jgi:hypothetical protein
MLTTCKCSIQKVFHNARDLGNACSIVHPAPGCLLVKLCCCLHFLQHALQLLLDWKDKSGTWLGRVALVLTSTAFNQRLHNVSQALHRSFSTLSDVVMDTRCENISYKLGEMARRLEMDMQQVVTVARSEGAELTAEVKVRLLPGCVARGMQ